MNGPKIAIGCVANVFSRQMHFLKAGDIEHGHKHPFDHLTLLASGSVKVTVNGEATEFKAPHMIYISGEHEHEIVALEDNTIAYCIVALRGDNKTGDILDPAMIPAGVNPLEFAAPVIGQDIEMTRG